MMEVVSRLERPVERRLVHRLCVRGDRAGPLRAPARWRRRRPSGCRPMRRARRADRLGRRGRVPGRAPGERLALPGERAHTRPARSWAATPSTAWPAPRAVAGFEERRPVIDGCEYREALQAVRVRGEWPTTSCPTLSASFSTTGSRPTATTEEAYGGRGGRRSSPALDRRRRRHDHPRGLGPGGGAEPRPSSPCPPRRSHRSAAAGEARMDRRQLLHLPGRPGGQLRPG